MTRLSKEPIPIETDDGLNFWRGLKYAIPITVVIWLVIIIVLIEVLK